MAGVFTLTFGDESQEESSVGFYTPTLTNLNFATYGEQGVGSAEEDLVTAVSAFSRGTLMKRQLSSIVAEDGAEYPVDPDAQGEVKAQFRYRDSANNRIYRFEIPVYNMTAKDAGKDSIDMTHAAVVALQDALAFYRGPAGGNVTLLSGKLVGRNI